MKLPCLGPRPEHGKVWAWLEGPWVSRTGGLPRRTRLASAEKPFEIAASELNKVLGHANETRTLRDRDGDVRRCGRAPNYEHGRSATNRCLHWSGLRGWTAVMPDCLQTAMRSQSQRPCFASFRGS